MHIQIRLKPRRCLYRTGQWPSVPLCHCAIFSPRRQTLPCTKMSKYPLLRKHRIWPAPQTVLPGNGWNKKNPWKPWCGSWGSESWWLVTCYSFIMLYRYIMLYIYISLRFYAVKRSQDLILWVKVPRFCLLKSPSWRFFPWSCPRWTKLVTPCCMASTPSWQKTELEPREPENVPRLGWKQQIYGYGSIPVKIGFQ